MIKRVLVLSEENLLLFIEACWEEYHLPTPEWALISISSFVGKSTGEKIDEKINFRTFNLVCSRNLFMKFGDFGKEEFEKYKEKNANMPSDALFNEVHAQKILDFVNEINETKPGENPIECLVIQCGAGVSRSGAVGLFVNRYLKLDEKEFRKINSVIRPNEHVLSVLMQKSGLRDDYENFWKKYEKPNEKIRFDE